MTWLCAFCRALLQEHIVGAGHTWAGGSNFPHALVPLDGGAVHGGLQSPKRRGKSKFESCPVLHHVCRPECHYSDNSCGKSTVNLEATVNLKLAEDTVMRCNGAAILKVVTIPQTVCRLHQSFQCCSGLRCPLFPLVQPVVLERIPSDEASRPWRRVHVDPHQGACTG